jgi:hypothetical protein
MVVQGSVLLSFHEISLMPEILGIKPNAQAIAYCLGFNFNA